MLFMLPIIVSNNVLLHHTLQPIFDVLNDIFLWCNLRRMKQLLHLPHLSQTTMPASRWTDRRAPGHTYRQTIFRTDRRSLCTISPKFKKNDRTVLVRTVVVSDGRCDNGTLLNMHKGEPTRTVTTKPKIML